jgi:diadenosine tetraphosphate (Ap4A) HIT family hydrolase
VPACFRLSEWLGSSFRREARSDGRCLPPWQGAQHGPRYRVARPSDNSAVAAWRDGEQWRALRDGTACPICNAGRPRGVIAESQATWVSSAERVTCRGYACVISRRHVVEPYELKADERNRFFSDVAAVAQEVADLFRPVKLNYEIHGNTIAHLHLHLFPRYLGDPFEGGPIRATERLASHSRDDLERMARAFGSALNG